MRDESDFRTKFKIIGIIGLGLMGGSFGKAIKTRHPDIRVIGFDHSRASAENAKLMGCVDRCEKSLNTLARAADLIVVATPMRTYKSILTAIDPSVWEDTWLTDLGSVKGPIHQIAATCLPAHAKVVGGHPMAGSEKCGCENSDPDLFESAAYYLTSSNLQWTKPVRELAESLGADVRVVSFEDHDRIVSVSSHVPHITASMLVKILHPDIALSDTGGGFHDTTRIAGSDPVMWTDILLTNKSEILSSLEELHKEIHKVAKMIENEDEASIFEYLEDSRCKRLGKEGTANGNHNRRKAI